MNRRSNHDKRLFNAYYGAISGVVDSVLSKIRQGKSSGAIPSATSISSAIRKKVRPAYNGLIVDGILAGLNDSEEVYGKPLPIFMKKEISEEDFLLLGMGNTVKEISNESMKLVTGVGKTVQGSLSKQLELSAKANEGQPELINRILGEKKHARWQAKRIAQTETTRAFNASSLAGYEKSGVVGKKEWVTNLMGNPRSFATGSGFDHIAANGEVVAVNKPFVRTGESLMSPGDGAGSPGNVINCHCGMMPVVGRLPKPVTSETSTSRRIKPKIPNNYKKPPVQELGDLSQINTFAANNVAIKGGKISKVEAIELADYMGSNKSFQINMYLRSSGKGFTEELKAKLDNTINKISNAIGKSKTTSNIITYRGVSGNVPKMRIGDIITDKGFMSTSLDMTRSFDYIIGEGRLMEIRLTKGTKALYEKSISRFGKKFIRNECELILPKGTILKKIGVKEIEGLKVDIMEVIS